MLTRVFNQTYSYQNLTNKNDIIGIIKQDYTQKVQPFNVTNTNPKIKFIPGYKQSVRFPHEWLDILKVGSYLCINENKQEYVVNIVNPSHDNVVGICIMTPDMTPDNKARFLSLYELERQQFSFDSTLEMSSQLKCHDIILHGSDETPRDILQLNFTICNNPYVYQILNIQYLQQAAISPINYRFKNTPHLIYCPVLTANNLQLAPDGYRDGRVTKYPYLTSGYQYLSDGQAKGNRQIGIIPLPMSQYPESMCITQSYIGGPAGFHENPFSDFNENNNTYQYVMNNVQKYNDGSLLLTYKKHSDNKDYIITRGYALYNNAALKAYHWYDYEKYKAQLDNTDYVKSSYINLYDAGDWYLPTAGEWLHIAANWTKIQEALMNLQKLPNYSDISILNKSGTYWTSTYFNTNHIWTYYTGCSYFRNMHINSSCIIRAMRAI